MKKFLYWMVSRTCGRGNGGDVVSNGVDSLIFGGTGKAANDEEGRMAA